MARLGRRGFLASITAALIAPSLKKSVVEDPFYDYKSVYRTPMGYTDPDEHYVLINARTQERVIVTVINSYGFSATRGGLNHG